MWRGYLEVENNKNIKREQIYDFLGLGRFFQSSNHICMCIPEVHTHAYTYIHTLANVKYESRRDFKGLIQVFELIISDTSPGISAWQPCWSTVIVCSYLIDCVPPSLICVSWRLQVERHPLMASLPVLWQITLCRLGRTLDLTEGEEETSESLCRWSAYQAKDEFPIPFESNFNYSKRGEETLVWWCFCLCSLEPVLPFCSAR